MKRVINFEYTKSDTLKEIYRVGTEYKTSDSLVDGDLAENSPDILFNHSENYLIYEKGSLPVFINYIDFPEIQLSSFEWLLITGTGIILLHFTDGKNILYDFLEEDEHTKIINTRDSDKNIQTNFEDNPFGVYYLHIRNGKLETEKYSSNDKYNFSLPNKVSYEFKIMNNTGVSLKGSEVTVNSRKFQLSKEGNTIILLQKELSTDSYFSIDKTLLNECFTFENDYTILEVR